MWASLCFFTCNSCDAMHNGYRLPVCLSVCLYITLWYCIKTAEYQMMQLPLGSTETITFCGHISCGSSHGITQSKHVKWDKSKLNQQFLNFSLQYLLISDIHSPTVDAFKRRLKLTFSNSPSTPLPCCSPSDCHHLWFSIIMETMGDMA